MHYKVGTDRCLTKWGLMDVFLTNKVGTDGCVPY